MRSRIRLVGGAPPPPPDFAPQGAKNGSFFGPRRGPENRPFARPPRIKVLWGGVGGLPGPTTPRIRGNAP